MLGQSKLSAAVNILNDFKMSLMGEITLAIPVLRFTQPLLLALALLFAQQGSMLHTLSHSFAEKTQQQNKQTPHSPACEQCTSYAQLGGALNSSHFSVELHVTLTQYFAPLKYNSTSHYALPGIARGPPIQLFA